jgi:uncharacterized protein YjlB
MSEDDGFIPNHPRWPLIVYKGAVRLSRSFDPASVLEELFDSHGWGSSWRNGIYAYAHYHSGTHEVLGIVRGTAEVQFGGVNGSILGLEEGDVAILPAGTGHRRLKASADLWSLELTLPGADMTNVDRKRTETERYRGLRWFRVLARIPFTGKRARSSIFGGMKTPNLNSINSSEQERLQRPQSRSARCSAYDTGA